MKVSELIMTLHECDQDADVHFSYNYGDHWHTVVAPEVETVEEGRVVNSAYHNMPKLLDEDEKGWDAAKPVVVLS